MARAARNPQVSVPGHLFVVAQMAILAVPQSLILMEIGRRPGMAVRASALSMGCGSIRLIIDQRHKSAREGLGGVIPLAVAMETELLDLFSLFRIRGVSKPVALQTGLVLGGEGWQFGLFRMTNATLLPRRFGGIVQTGANVVEPQLFVRLMATQTIVVFLRMLYPLGAMHPIGQVVDYVVVTGQALIDLEKVLAAFVDIDRIGVKIQVGYRVMTILARELPVGRHVIFGRVDKP
jgi:hypothetical protein